MTLLVAKASSRALAWLSAKAGCVLTRDAKGIEAVDSLSGDVRGCVGYDCWTENAVQAHMAVDAPIVWRALIPECFVYPFIQAKKGLLLGIVPAHRWKACRFIQHLGFRELTRIPDGWDKGDPMIIYKMRREDCQWLT